MRKLSDNPTYDVFLENIEYCYGLYKKGLKKESNNQTLQFVSEFQSALSKEIQQELLYNLCYDVCDGKDIYELRRRGNGRLAYPLDKLVWEYIWEHCQAGDMPQLRWAYEIYNYNPFDHRFDSAAMLKKAFFHKDSDQRTVDLYFQHLLSILDWGAHHFPEDCIIKHTVFENTVEECHTISAQKNINPQQLTALGYYEILYRCFYEYQESGKTKDFYSLCQNAGIDFDGVPAYYYR